MIRRSAFQAVLLGLTLAAGGAQAQDDRVALERGEYLFYAGACNSCHTDHEHDGAFLAGGRRMDSAFGTFYTPNITPAPETGIGDWTLDDFEGAMIEGVRPDGAHYYPIFPYRWYTGMTPEDVADLFAYLRSVPPVENRVQPHELPFPFNIRFLLLGWKILNFDQGDTVRDEEKSEAWNRGAYLVNHLGHCGACHTPKILKGAVFRTWEHLAGSEVIPGPYPAPNITPHEVFGIGDWSTEDVVRALKQSITPEGEPIRGPMAEYVVSGSSHLAEADLAAIAEYLMSIEVEQGPVGATEERLDRRLVGQDLEVDQPGSGTGSGGGGMGSVGMGLLRSADEGRTRAK